MRKLTLLSLAGMLSICSQGTFAGFNTAVLQNMTYQSVVMDIESTATSLKNMYTFTYDFSAGETESTYFARGDAVSFISWGTRFAYGPQFITAQLGSKILANTSIIYDNKRFYKYDSTEVDLYVAIEQGVYDNSAGGYVNHFIPFQDVSNNGEAWFASNGSSCSYTQDKSTWGIDGKCDHSGITITQHDGPAARKAKLYIYFPTKPTHPVTLNFVVAKLLVNQQLVDVSPDTGAGKPYKDSRKAFRDYTLTGTITFPNSCRTSAATQDVNLQSVNPAQFTTKGKLPQNYTAKEATLTFTCDNDIGSSYGGMNWHLEATGPSVNNESVNGILMATATSGTVNNLGVGLSSNQAGTTKIDASGATDYPATVSGKVATAKFYAYPTMTSDAKPTGAGDYKATATVRFDIP